MVRALAQQLAEWAGDPAITRIVVTAAEAAHFRPAVTCAGSTSCGRRAR